MDKPTNEKTMEKSVNELFGRYQEFFRKAIQGEADIERLAASYTSAVIGAAPAGVMVSQNDDQFKQVLQQGFEHYRQIGTKDMRTRNVRISPIDEHHCVAHVAWTATYGRKDQSDIAIDFDVHYLIQKLDGEPKIFGWVSGDEQATLKQHGII
jgi:hypothetical protein